MENPTLVKIQQKYISLQINSASHWWSVSLPNSPALVVMCSHLCLQCCLPRGCLWMIWIHLPQRGCEPQAPHCCHRDESCPAAAGNGAQRPLLVAAVAPAEGVARDSLQVVLSTMWHTPVAENSQNGFKSKHLGAITDVRRFGTRETNCYSDHFCVSFKAFSGCIVSFKWWMSGDGTPNLFKIN